MHLEYAAFNTAIDEYLVRIQAIKRFADSSLETQTEDPNPLNQEIMERLIIDHENAIDAQGSLHQDVKELEEKITDTTKQLGEAAKAEDHELQASIVEELYALQGQMHELLAKVLSLIHI